MFVIEIDPIYNNQNTGCTLVFGSQTSLSEVFSSAEQSILLKERYGLVSKKETLEVLLNIKNKLGNFKNEILTIT